MVIWPKDAYLAEAYRQLNNNNHYKKLTYDPTDEILTQPKTLAFNLHKSRIIDSLAHKFLTSDTQARTPQLYLLPKTHKPDIPGRPIISGCEGLTVKLSQYADHLLKPLLYYYKTYPILCPRHNRLLTQNIYIQQKPDKQFHSRHH